MPFTGASFAMGWLESVTFVSLMSMVALFLGSFSAWQAARTEIKQDQDIEEAIEERDDVEKVEKDS